MATIVLDFSSVSNANPYMVSNHAGFSDVGAASVQVFSNEWFGNNTSLNSLWKCDTLPNVDQFSLYITSGAVLTTARGFAFFNSSGNGFMFIARNTDVRIFALSAYALSGSALATYAITLAVDDVIRCDVTQSTGNYVVKRNGTTLGTFVNTTYTSGLYGGILSRNGGIKNFTLEYTPPYSVVSINSGSPITSSQSAVAAVTTGFTGLPTTITTNAAGVTCGTIGGTTNAPTWVQTIRTDGAVFPKSGTVVTYTFTKSAETANGDQTINKDADQTSVIVASPINDDITCLFGAINSITGRSAANTDEVYHAIPAPMLTNGIDTILPADAIAPDGTMQFYNAGTFPCWVWTAATGVNYYYSVTITESGSVIVETPASNTRTISNAITRAISNSITTLH